MIGKMLSGRYELLEKIGEGGMAEVYKARCHVLQRFVAVKILKAQFNEDEEFIEKFDKESKSAAGLNHPNIVNIFDVGQEGQTRYIVMEFIDGVTLKRYLKEQNGPLPENDVIRISIQVASALDHAHQNQIIHRDIKPQNIMIAKGGVVKVADFGIAQAVTSSTIVQTKKMLGTVHYSSPEQSRGTFVDHRTDLYSLGIMMYEMSTGRLPFSGDSAIAIALKHMKEDVLPPTQLNPSLSSGFEEVILKALKKNADSRYQSASEMIVDLKLVKVNPDASLDYADDDDNPTQFLPDMEVFEKMTQAKREKTKTKKKKKSGKPGMSRLSLVTVVLLAFVAAVLIFGVVGFTILRDKFAYQEVEVPNVVSLSFDEAKRILNDRGFYIEEESLRFSNVIPKGAIIEQSEEPGEMLKEGFTIKVVISKGKNLVEMPNLLQKDLDDAKIVLENNELILGDIRYVANDLPQGYVVSQDPVSGTEVEVGQPVDLVVSQGNSLDEYLMPSLLGLTYDEALTRFEGKSINLITGDYIYSEYDQDLIAAQDIAQGETIHPGTTVTVNLSLGQAESTKSFKFYTEYFEGDTETVTIEIVKNGESSIVYQQQHSKEEESFIVDVTASGNVTLNVYFGDLLFNSYSEQF